MGVAGLDGAFLAFADTGEAGAGVAYMYMTQRDFSAPRKVIVLNKIISTDKTVTTQ